MAEYINKVEFEKYKCIGDAVFDDGKKENKEFIFILDEDFEALPTIDIVHCKDCRHRNTFGIDAIDCRHTPDNWFCADGERRNNG